MMHSGLGFMVDNHPTPGWSPRTRVVTVNHKSQTNMHYVLYPEPVWCLLLLHTVNRVTYRKHHYNFHGI